MFRASAAALAAALTVTAATAGAETAMPFALDWKFEGPAAPYFVALDEGHFAAEDLSVQISEGAGSLDAIPKVATGAFPVGFADINSLMKFLDQNPGAPVIAAMMIYDKPPFAVVGRKSQGIEAPKDLEGRKLGAPPPDGAWAQFPIFAAENGLDMAAITVEPVGFPTREPMLAEGQVDAVTGFSFSSTLNLIRLGVPEDDISTLLMADHGVALYGNAIIVNTDFAEANPEAVTGFLRAVAKGWKDSVADPEAAIAALIQRNPAADAALEERRLQMSIADNVVTDWVKANGMGNIDPDRMARAIEQTKSVYEFQNAPDAALYFDPQWLPADGSLTFE
ncbi:ABC transporter substrate-binding protein [Cereibacter azotoformans]|uniref:NitT/TauT family transport system substrate-binding protein n=2 Tax=Cereibacter TaxID=1653176 RepID=A0A2T5K2W0_9RHOB|nr:ABC transporter substrate-binding protein [Cereibacter azotoformans]AXQ94648.1 ABC transporter substrate-binding protein [Cereibacter sphaeroides]MBO4170504.1 ABC transporter substrate-binding protein [Cereibacter azotoformans]PTR16773.1 NitT/TauT family transport system substrate-binding protein [Cereibacter azotoformans]UIJ30208.1 ABC transporter substrate-binding protein [Cereibacter azotoformans]ULB10866.1 ABC transporter substrate-binding protein [Cereibacter azotoformans]